MTVYELLDATGGFILINKAHVVVDGAEVVVGYFDGPELVYTPEGQEMADKYSNGLTAAKPTRTRKTKDTTPEAVAVESTGVESEL